MLWHGLLFAGLDVSPEPEQPAEADMSPLQRPSLTGHCLPHAGGLDQRHDRGFTTKLLLRLLLPQ